MWSLGAAARAPACGGETGGSLSHSGWGMGCFVSAGFKVWAIRVVFHVESYDISSVFLSNDIVVKFIRNNFRNIYI